MVFWWTGRGFLSLLFLIGVVGLFGACVSFTIGEAAFDTHPWLWGVALLLAGAVNWFAGSWINRKALARPRARGVLGRLVYPARHRFLSLPMEDWSLPAVFGGLAIFIASLA